MHQTVLALSLLLATASALAQDAPAPCEQRDLCVVVDVYRVEKDGKPIVKDEWLAGQLAHANKVFAPAGIGFRWGQRKLMPASFLRLRTAAERDALAEQDRTPGHATLFIVGRVDDLGGKRGLGGVHWRYRKDRTQTWIIMSPMDVRGIVLAHELGHFFNLPHSKDPESIMNKTPRLTPPVWDWGFTKSELARIDRARKQMHNNGRLPPRD